MNLPLIEVEEQELPLIEVKEISPQELIAELAKLDSQRVFDQQ